MDMSRAEEALELISRYIRDQDRAEFARALGAEESDDERSEVIARFAELFA